MTESIPRLAEVGPWAKEKLKALERYLDFYTKVMKRQRWRTIYIDAFAGGGRAIIRQSRPVDDASFESFLLSEGTEEPEQQEFIRGSPRVALELANPFSTYVFIDADRERVAALNALGPFTDGRIIHVRQGTAASEIDWVLSHRLPRDKYRGVAFLDPFGAHLEWRTIEALASTGIFEVLINFPLHMAINRLMTVDGVIPPNWRAQLDAFFPPGWHDHVYSSDPGLFAGTDFEPGIEKRQDAIDRLLRFYTNNLRNVFGHVSEPKLIRNTRRAPLYYLLWAGPHPKGLEGANHILRMGERLSRQGPNR